MAARYARWLIGNDMVDALKPNGSLSFLIDGVPDLDGDPYTIDVQLRENNQLMYYHGTTRVLVVTLSERDRGVCFRVSANPTYSSNAACSELFKKLQELGACDPSGAGEPFWRYLQEAVSLAHPRYYKNKKEGYWQNRLCIRFGVQCQEDDDWLIIDRECVIGFADKAEKSSVLHPRQVHFEAIRHGLQTQDPKRWGRPNEENCLGGELHSSLGDELDMLAIDKDGQLLAIELKHGSSAKGIYWGPLQVRTYESAFNAVLSQVRADICELIRQKVNLCLLPTFALKRLEKACFSSVVPVLAIAAPNLRSSCWNSLAKVMELAGTVSMVTIDSKNDRAVYVPEDVPISHIELDEI